MPLKVLGLPEMKALLDISSANAEETASPKDMLDLMATFIDFVVNHDLLLVPHRVFMQLAWTIRSVESVREAAAEKLIMETGGKHSNPTTLARLALTDKRCRRLASELAQELDLTASQMLTSLVAHPLGDPGIVESAVSEGVLDGLNGILTGTDGAELRSTHLSLEMAMHTRMQLMEAAQRYAETTSAILERANMLD